MAKEYKHSIEMTVEELVRSAGFSEPEIELILMKGDLLALLSKEQRKRKLNHTEFAKFLGIPKSRWSSIFSDPDKVTIDYLLLLAGKCGLFFKLTRKAA
ncbi:hypothetical protein D3C87_253620 [compost metagenome]